MPSSFLPTAAPADMGLHPARWERVLDFANGLCVCDELPALSFEFQLCGKSTGVQSFGRRLLGSSEPVDAHTCFLVASLTKPILAASVLVLVEAGKLGLNQRVVDILPEFNDAPKRPITIRHLLTHTSGLPDMLPNNQKLRMEQAPLSRFVAGTCAVSLDFPPGRGAQYQSMGYALLGEIITRLSGRPYGEFVREQIFVPLNMTHSWLGLPAEKYGQLPVAEVRVPDEQQTGTEWNWNSRYWQEFGAPWGGLLSTVTDLSRFCRMFLNNGCGPTQRLLSSASIQWASTNRLPDFEGIPEYDRRNRGWGLGWRMNWPDHRGAFGDLLSPLTYGHWGVTGTLFWIDPAQEAALVAVSTQPLGKDLSALTRLSNLIIAARA